MQENVHAIADKAYFVHKSFCPCYSYRHNAPKRVTFPRDRKLGPAVHGCAAGRHARQSGGLMQTIMQC